MVNPLSENFNKILSNKEPDNGFFVPILRWCSAYEPNIELCQRINRKFYKGNQKVLIRELTLSNMLKRFISYPKMPKEDSKLDFFYKDVCKYYGWSKRELDLNMNVINIEELKPFIARKFGYDNKQRKALGLDALKGLRCF